MSSSYNSRGDISIIDLTIEHQGTAIVRPKRLHIVTKAQARVRLLEDLLKVPSLVERKGSVSKKQKAMNDTTK